MPTKTVPLISLRQLFKNNFIIKTSMLFSNVCNHLLLISMEVLFFIIQFIYNISILKFFTIFTMYGLRFFTIYDHICRSLILNFDHPRISFITCFSSSLNFPELSSFLNVIERVSSSRSLSFKNASTLSG